MRFTEGRDALAGRGGAGGAGVVTMLLYLSVLFRQMRINVAGACAPCTPIYPLQTQSVIDKSIFDDVIDYAAKELVVTQDRDA